MNKVKLLLVAALMVFGSFVSSTSAKAMCSSANGSLQACYHDCNQIFDPPISQACRLGCYIGCVWSGGRS